MGKHVYTQGLRHISCLQTTATQFVKESYMRLSSWDESRKYRGQWWSPNQPGRHFSGVLRFEEGRPRLTIWSPAVGQEFYALSNPDTIYGELQTGEKVTLWDFNGSHLQHRMTSKPYTKSRRHFTHAILGDHLSTPKRQYFKFSSYRFRGLLEFSERLEPIPASLAKTERPRYEDAKFSVEINETIYQITARINNPRQLEQSERRGGSYFPSSSGDDVRVTFECTPPAPVEVHNELMMDFQRLLAFVCIDIIPVENEWLAVSSRSVMHSVMRRDSVHDVKKYATADIFNFNILVTLHQVPPEILLPRWWKAIKELYPATEIISTYNQGIRGVLESSTASVIALGERLQEVIDPNAKRYELSRYREIQAKISEKFSDDAELAGMLKSLLSNRLTLRGKLEILSNAVTPERFSLMGIESSAWIRDVRDVRDHIAHTGSHVKGRSSDAATKLMRVNLETRAIVSILILKLMELDDQVLDQAAEIIGKRLRRLYGS